VSPVGSRRAARRAAVVVLYQADLTGTDPEQTLAASLAQGEGADDPFTRELVSGVATSLPEIDDVIGLHTEGWSVSRLAPVDRAILRLATFELLHRQDVPVGAVINEAVEAAKTLSSEESGGFVNGILGRIARERVGTDDR
jgi:transcription antitermination protein NusB